MKPVLLLVHGWGSDATFWAPLRDALPPDAALTWDLGFFGDPVMPAPPPGRPIVAVGHSFGLLWLLHHRPVTWQMLVSINGFTRFVQHERFPNGIAPRVLDRMTSLFATAPLRVVTDFRSRIGCTVPPLTTLNQERLLDGLRAMAGWDERQATIHRALCGENDPLILPKLSQACFDEPIIDWHHGGHLLPLEAPAWCAGRLLELAARLA